MNPAMDTAVLFYPRGGSAQVVRYLLRELGTRGYTTRLHAGSLGSPGDHSHAPTFYPGLDLQAYDYNQAQAAFVRGANPQHTPRPFHPPTRTAESAPTRCSARSRPATPADSPAPGAGICAPTATPTSGCCTCTTSATCRTPPAPPTPASPA